MLRPSPSTAPNGARGIAPRYPTLSKFSAARATTPGLGSSFPEAPAAQNSARGIAPRNPTLSHFPGHPARDLPPGGCRGHPTRLSGGHEGVHPGKFSRHLFRLFYGSQDAPGRPDANAFFREAIRQPVMELWPLPSAVLEANMPPYSMI